MRCSIRRTVALVSLIATVAGVAVTAPSPAGAATTVVVRPIRFPVDGTVSYTDTFGACRDGCTRSHQGQDLMGTKLLPLVAAADGTVTAIRTDSSGTSGNYVRITDAEGWHYYYMHVNNDSPGTDDGKNPAAWRFAPGVALGAEVWAAQMIGYMGDSGNAEGTSPHVHFEIRTPSGTAINAYESLQRASRAPAAPRIFMNDVLGGTATGNTQWAQVGATVLACDIDGDGDDEPVQYANRFFSWRADVDDAGVAGSTIYGGAGDLPVCGDWDGDGRDGLGIVRGQMWHLRNSFTSGYADLSVDHGRAGLPVAGDWDGDGDDDPGTLEGRVWTLRSTTPAGTTAHRVVFGSPGDIPLTGDWNADGTDEIGVRRGKFNHLRDVVDGAIVVRSYGYGTTTDVALTADFDDDGDDTVSIWRPRP
jgi:hypothetical protein